MKATRWTSVASLVLVTASAAHAAGGGVKGTVTNAVSKAPVVNAVVMIDGPAVPAARATRVAIDQRNDTFVPHVVAIAVGTTVDFPNDDPHLHNVFSASPAKRFDLGMYGKGETKSVTFDTPGVVRVRCNVHPSMEAFIIVHPNPYVAVTDAHGVYTITGVPAGSYDVRTWDEKLGEKRGRVDVHDEQVTPLDVRLSAEH